MGSNRSNSVSTVSGQPLLQDKIKFDVPPQEYASLAIIKFDEEGKVGLKHPELRV